MTVLKRTSVEQSRDAGGFGVKGRDWHRTVATAGVCQGLEKGSVCGMGKGCPQGLRDWKQPESGKVSQDKIGEEAGPNPVSMTVRCATLCFRNSPPQGGSAVPPTSLPCAPAALGGALGESSDVREQTPSLKQGQSNSLSFAGSWRQWCGRTGEVVGRGASWVRVLGEEAHSGLALGPPFLHAADTHCGAGMKMSSSRICLGAPGSPDE